MKFADLKNKSAPELQQMLNDLRGEQFKARMQHGSGQLSNTAAMRRLRRDIARVKTMQTRMSRQQGARQQGSAQQAASADAAGEQA